MHFFFHSGSEFELFRVASRVAGQPAGELLPRSLPQTEREARRQASSRSAELLKFIPLCILQYPPFFFCPFQNNKPLAILVILNSSPKHPYLSFSPPPLTPLLLLLLLPLSLSLSLSRTYIHTHTQTHGFVSKEMDPRFFFASFSKVLDLLEGRRRRGGGRRRTASCLWFERENAGG